MKKIELATYVAQQSGEQLKLVVKIIDQFIDQTISKMATGATLEMKQFGCFEVVVDPQRDAGDIQIPARRLPSFRSDEPTDAPSEMNVSMVQSIAATCKASPDATAQILNKVFTTVKKAALKGERVTIEGFGTFEVTTVPSRTLIDPDTGESFSSQQKRYLHFSSGRDLKVAVEEGESAVSIKN